LDPEEIDKDMKNMRKSIIGLKSRFTELSKRDNTKYKAILKLVEKILAEL